MGISKLETFLTQKIKTNTYELTALTNKNIAIDGDWAIVVWYHLAKKIHFKYNCRNLEEIVAEETAKHFLRWIKNLLIFKIHPVLCFDGDKDNKYKENTKEKRQKAKKKQMQQYKDSNDEKEASENYMGVYNSDTIDLAIKKVIAECKKHKILTLVAGETGTGIVNEAEALCAQLVHNKFCTAAYTGDTDIYAYGTPLVITDFNFNNRTFSVRIMDVIFNELGLTYESFIEMCILAGNDYNTSYIKISNAYSMILKYKTIEKIPKGFIAKLNNFYEKCNADVVRKIYYGAKRKLIIPREKKEELAHYF